MKRMIAVLIGLLLLTGCAQGARNESPVTSGSAYQLSIASSDLAIGQSRLVLIVWDGPVHLTGGTAMTVELFNINSAGEGTDKLGEYEATPYQMGDTQYWVSYPDFPAAGNFGVVATVTNAEGQRVETTALLQVDEAAEAPVVGQDAPPSETRTLDDAPIEELTSAGPYVERFYQMSVAEAASSGTPSIIVFATPGYCTSSICAPVMQTVDTVSSEFDDGLNVVHVEIFRDFEAQEYDPAVAEWNLPSEPWIFILDEDGKIAGRLDGVVGADELRQTVSEVVGG